MNCSKGTASDKDKANSPVPDFRGPPIGRVQIDDREHASHYRSIDSPLFSAIDDVLRLAVHREVLHRSKRRSPLKCHDTFAHCTIAITACPFRKVVLDILLLQPTSLRV